MVAVVALWVICFYYLAPNPNFCLIFSEKEQYFPQKELTLRFL